MLKLKKGDEVIITAGKDRGKRGKIEKIFTGAGTVLIPGLNQFKRHMKKRDEKNPGGIISVPRPIPMGNISLVCPKCAKTTRIGFIVKGGKKARFCKKCGEKV